VQVIEALAGLAFLVYASIRAWAQDAQLSPDAIYYLDMAAGRRVPAPYCRRIFQPWLSARLARVSGLDVRRSMRVVGSCAAALCIALSAWLAWRLGASPPLVLACLALLVATDGLFGSFTTYPYCPDALAACFALAAGFVPGWPAAALLLLAAVTKEGPFVIGAVFLCLSGTLEWWTTLPGLVALAVLTLAVRAAPPDQEWLKNPLRAAQWAKRTDQFEWQKALSGLKAMPFVAAAVLPGTAWAGPACAAALLAWLQTVPAMDRVRLVAACVPWVMPVTVMSCPSWLLWPWLVVSIFWPFRRDML
jgi:hypothetical protein